MKDTPYNRAVRRFLIDIPAKLFDLWLFAYQAVLVAMVLAAMISVTAILVLALFGVRWGW
jgi:hypothetical protein